MRPPIPALLCCLALLSLPWPAAAQEKARGDQPLTVEEQVDQLWEQVDQLWQQSKIVEIVPVVERIVKLAPEDVQAWTFLGWHQAYNLSVEKELGLDEQEQIRKGIAALRRGVKTVPRAAELRWELGYTYYDRIGDTRSAAQVFEETLRLVDQGRLELMDPEETRPLQEWRRFLMRTLAHVYERTIDLDRALAVYERMIKDYRNEDVARFTAERIRKDYREAWRHFKARRYREALKAADAQLAREQPKPTFVGLYLKAESHIQLEEWEEAGKTLIIILNKNLRERVALEKLKRVEQKLKEQGKRLQWDAPGQIPEVREGPPPIVG